jgi:hypothetical protein
MAKGKRCSYFCESCKPFSARSILSHLIVVEGVDTMFSIPRAIRGYLAVIYWKTKKGIVAYFFTLLKIIKTFNSFAKTLVYETNYYRLLHGAHTCCL